MAVVSEQGLEAIDRLKSTEPPLWLDPSPSLAEAARTASQHLFHVIRPQAPKSPLDELLVNGFDAEQIWQQIDLQSQPLISKLRRDIRRFEKNPEETAIFEKVVEGDKIKKQEIEADDDSTDMDTEMDDDDDDDDDEEEEEEGGGSDEEPEKEEVGSEEEEERVIEDEFLKLNDLERFIDQEEAREYGFDGKKNEKSDKKKIDHGSDEEEDEEDGEEDGEEEEEEEEEDDDDELDVFGVEGDDAGLEDLEGAKYDDFFGSENNKPKQKPKSIDFSEEDSGSDDEQVQDKRKDYRSTHEKQLEKLQSEIEQMEKANLEPKTWTMQGEVTAAKRPPNSALAADLDFEHNIRPAPVITEEVTASIEEIIRKRITQGLFDDLQKAPSAILKAPREVKELDENKSKKGLAEVYEDEYVQKADPAAAPLSLSDKQKNEAKMLFKKVCLKLDALSHFHFAPKPVIEDMCIQANVPALAMEEIAPMVVSDAAMLAPEEVFSGKGDIKEEEELTQADRKRKRANHKRKSKSEKSKTIIMKPQASAPLDEKKVDTKGPFRKRRAMKGDEDFKSASALML